jgi:gluconolactonase
MAESMKIQFQVSRFKFQVTPFCLLKLELESRNSGCALLHYRPMNRRKFLTGSAGVATLAAVAPAISVAEQEWQPSQRYPDPAIKIVDESFARYRLGAAKVERIATGFRWAEGPVWFGDGRYLLWSDIPNNRMMRWDEETGAVSVFRQPSNNSNGNARDRQGRLLTCEHDARRVARTEYDGSTTVIADSFDGKPLNSPNDIVCKSDGSIWFTDPPFGILGFYEGHNARPELPTNVYRWDPQTKKLAVVAGDINRPNGLAFSPDETKLYIIESGSGAPRTIRVADVADNGTRLGNLRVLITAETEGTPDGLRVDVDGNLWCGWGMGAEGLDGVHVFNPAGKLIGRIDLPERCANLCFGGRNRNRLFMAASTSVYSLYVNTQGAALV